MSDLRVEIEMTPAGDQDCHECLGVGWTMDDPGGPLKDMPPMVRVRACSRCNPDRSGVASYRYRASLASDGPTDGASDA